MSDSVIASHKTNEFAEKDDCKDGVDCSTQPLEPNDFVLLNLATQMTVKCFVGLIHEMRLMVRTPDF
jgi:hypothetical protein